MEKLYFNFTGIENGINWKCDKGDDHEWEDSIGSKKERSKDVQYVPVKKLQSNCLTAQLILKL